MNYSLLIKLASFMAVNKFLFKTVAALGSVGLSTNPKPKIPSYFKDFKFWAYFTKARGTLGTLKSLNYNVSVPTSNY